MKIQKDKPFSRITIVIENQDELNQLQGLLNHAYIVDSLPLLQTLSEDVECCSNDYYSKLAVNIKSKTLKQAGYRIDNMEKA